MPLVIDLLRHGAAEPSHALGDFHRSLTPDGERGVRDVARQIVERSGPPHRAFASPWRRAWQTATLVLAAWGEGIPIEPLPELEPDRDPVAVLEAVRTLGLDDGRILLVGHQPQMGLLTTLLVGSEAPFSPGTLIRFECPPGTLRPARRLFVLTPQAPPDPPSSR